MQKSLKAVLSVVVLGAALLLSGCKDKGAAFIGHWMTTEEHPSELTITYDEGVYHIDGKTWGVFHAIGGARYDVFKAEGKAESDSVLTVPSQMGNQTARIENSTLFFINREFKKV